MTRELLIEEKIDLSISPLIHVTCCEADTLSFCGLDLADKPLTDAPSNCIVCVELDRIDWCPIKHRVCEGNIW